MLEELADRIACLGSEEGERSILRRHKRDRDAHRAAIGQVRPREERELIEGKRPAGLDRKRKDDAAHCTGYRLLEERGKGGAVLWAAEGQRVGHRLHRPRSEREQEHVIRELFTHCQR